MASDAVLELTDENFDSEVLSSETPVLVDFWAEWCMPCKAIAPIIDELADDFRGRVKVGKIDTDANKDVPSKFGINAIPTIILFHEGEIVRKFIGVTPKQEFAGELEKLAG